MRYYSATPYSPRFEGKNRKNSSYKGLSIPTKFNRFFSKKSRIYSNTYGTHEGLSISSFMLYPVKQTYNIESRARGKLTPTLHGSIHTLLYPSVHISPTVQTFLHPSLPAPGYTPLQAFLFLRLSFYLPDSALLFYSLRPSSHPSNSIYPPKRRTSTHNHLSNLSPAHKKEPRSNMHVLSPVHEHIDSNIILQTSHADKNACSLRYGFNDTWSQAHRRSAIWPHRYDYPIDKVMDVDLEKDIESTMHDKDIQSEGDIDNRDEGNSRLDRDEEDDITSRAWKHGNLYWEPVGLRPCSMPESKYHCFNRSCRRCWDKWRDRVVYKVLDGLTVEDRESLRHISFSPPTRWGLKRLESEGGFNYLRSKAYSVMKKAGVEGAIVIFHPWRVRDKVKKIIKDIDSQIRVWTFLREEELLSKGSKTIELSPHFHLLAKGYLEKSNEFYNDTDWVYRNHSPNSEIDCMLKYLLSHTGLAYPIRDLERPLFKSYSYLGDLKNRGDR